MSIRVPFNDLSRTPESERAEIEAAIRRVITSGRYILGPEVERFEQEWAAYTCHAHCVGVASGTDALKIALRSAGVKPGHRVLTVANSAPATVTAVLEIGASPAYCDVDGAGLMDIDSYDRAWGGIAAILPVALHGRPVDARSITRVAQARDLPVVLDACQAHGGISVGDSGRAPAATAYSFYPTKNLGCLGDGGAIVTDRPEIAARAREARNYGFAERDRVGREPGFNSRLDEIQAAILLARLPRLNGWNQRRAQLTERYRRGMQDYEPRIIGGGSYHIVAMSVGSDARDRARERFREHGLETLVHYPHPTHRQPALDGGERWSLPKTDEWCAATLSLPMGNYTTDADVDDACETMLRWL